jgi:hypothetical protein
MLAPPAHWFHSAFGSIAGHARLMSPSGPSAKTATVPPIGMSPSSAPMNPVESISAQQTATSSGAKYHGCLTNIHAEGTRREHKESSRADGAPQRYLSGWVSE